MRHIEKPYPNLVKSNQICIDFNYNFLIDISFESNRELPGYIS